MVIVPTSALPSQRFYIVLDGQDCTLKLYWRQTRLYLDLYSGASPVRLGAVCECGANIVPGPNPDFKGSLHFIDLDGQSPPVWDKLGQRFFLVYLSEGEAVPALLRY